MCGCLSCRDGMVLLLVLLAVLGSTSVCADDLIPPRITCGSGVTCTPQPILSEGTVDLQPCAAGKVLRRNAADTAWQCDVVPVSTGLAGGQMLDGGTAATDSLTLDPSTSSAPTSGRVKMCSATPLLTASPSSCVTLFPDGLTSNVAAGQIISGIEVTSTFAQTDANGPNVNLFRAGYTWDTQGSAVAFTASHSGLLHWITVQNSNANTVVPGFVTAVDFRGKCQKAGSGSNFVI